MIKRFVTALAATGMLLGASPGKEFTDEVWEKNQDIYRAILEHPFLTEMQNGTLSEEVLRIGKSIIPRRAITVNLRLCWA